MLSLAMIVRDEADGIASVLKQAALFCDEMVVVDTGSVDNTVQIAQDHGAKVHQIEWPNSFCDARNYALDATQGEWVMHLDGHDYLPPETIKGLSDLDLDAHKDNDAIVLPMCIVNTGGKVLLTYPRERITRRHLRWQYDAHTIIAPYRPVKYNYPIHTLGRTGKKSKRALEVLERLYAQGDRTPRTVFYLARERFWDQQYANAVPMYKEWLEMHPVKWEKYSGLIDLAACYEMLGQKDLATDTRFAAVSVEPTRAEAWAALGNSASKERDYLSAELYYRNAANAVRPENGFVVEIWYTDFPETLANNCRKELEIQRRG